MTALNHELPALLEYWLPQQRWFAAKGRPVGAVAVHSSTPLLTDGEPLLDQVILAVRFDDGSPEQHYQVMVGRREHLRGELQHHEIGRVGDLLAYDGLGDPEVTDWLLTSIREGRRIGPIAFVPEPDARLDTDYSGRVLGVEQSNTSVSWGEQLILKLFRRVAPGLNPDLELHRALRSVDSTEVAALQGAIEGELDGEPATLAMVQDFAANSADGWRMALASVRDLLAEADLRADEVGGDFAGEASRLGETVAVVHDELRRALGTGDGDPRDLAAGWHRRLSAIAGEMTVLEPHVDAIRAAYDAVADLGSAIPVQRVHGDLHLGQTLRTPTGWLVIDFEGEPSASHAERVRPDSALRDVVGMLFSFNYAAFHQLLQWDPSAPPELDQDSQLVWRANEWCERNRSAFCDGYTLRSGLDPREHSALLRAFELDKAVYQVLYETRSRPTWVDIPLAVIRRLTTDADSVQR
ncbi:maltokinase N-terminal cap-like domain-containing protein [Pseudonocardia humida]|uniref:Maltokinase n=1 Tax=Pseudonocardia humida TaxID=2800819 RepID=A0ABT1A5B3_9PSEU|nr:aminoglycoside phosphotransferase [Pseudonocardia humida]MCO1658197.1 aminoglycoside phosphotransferase [Pseudonocardia humida]